MANGIDIGIDIIDAIALIRALLTSSLAADAETREKIAEIRSSVSEMPDQEVIQLARDIAGRTDEKLNAFIARLEGEA